MEDRRMAYPYTFTAKMINFPFKHYYNKNLLFRYYLYSLVVCLPVFWKIQKLTYSEGNVIKHQEYIKKERDEVKHHLDHLPNFAKAAGLVTVACLIITLHVREMYEQRLPLRLPKMDWHSFDFIQATNLFYTL